MSSPLHARFGPLSLAAALALTLSVASCGKKDEKVQVSAPEPVPNADASGKPNAAESTAPPDAGSLAELNFQNAEQGMASADSALQGKNYDLAADSLLKMQYSGMIKTEAESWKYNERMTLLQKNLADAAGSGDAKAQATIDKLRKSRMFR